MAETPRIEELRRRVQRDPASIAFAQLAEEYRRAGRFSEAIETCHGGLTHHPGYLSARVTLGRALLELGELDAAQLELKQVLRAAPENLAALRGLAEIHHRRGELQEALAHYRAALEFARNDPELAQAVEQIQRELEPTPAAPVVEDGLSFEEAKDTFLGLALDVPGLVPKDAAPAPAWETAPASQPVLEAAESPSADEAVVISPGSEASARPPVIEAGAPPIALELDRVQEAPWGLPEPSEPEAATERPGRVEPEVFDLGGAHVVEPAPDSVEPVVDVVESAPAVVEAVPDAVEPAAVPVEPGTAARIDALESWLSTILASRGTSPRR